MKILQVTTGDGSKTLLYQGIELQMDLNFAHLFRRQRRALPMKYGSTDSAEDVKSVLNVWV